MKPKSQVAYVAWEIWAFGVKPKSQVAHVAWEIWAFGRVGGEAEKRQVAYEAWEIAAFGRLGEAEKSGSICSVGNLGLWWGRR